MYKYHNSYSYSLLVDELISFFLITLQVVKVSCGGDHTLVLTDAGEVLAFGTSSNGQLGLGKSQNFTFC